MRINQISLLDFLGEPELRFRIPAFQRAYSWKAEQCDELWLDLLRAARARRSHFVGTLIYLIEGDAEPSRTCAVVDGQQRLTTLSLILIALAEHLDASGESFFGVDGAFIREHYLLVGENAKLELSRVDRPTFAAVAQGSPLPEKPSARVLENLELFRVKMTGDDFDALQLWQGLSSLVAIASQLDERKQAPAVFESFNSKGVPLVTADLVRNYLLIAQSHGEQARLFETYWGPIQGVFGDDPGSIRLNNAILGWLAVRFSKVRKFGDAQAFSIFKSYCEDEYDGTTDDLLDELYAFCMVWAENYRYHAVKKYKTADWAKLGHKTRVSNRPRKPLDDEASYEYYTRHFGVNPQW